MHIRPFIVTSRGDETLQEDTTGPMVANRAKWTHTESQLFAAIRCFSLVLVCIRRFSSSLVSSCIYLISTNQYSPLRASHCIRLGLVPRATNRWRTATCNLASEPTDQCRPIRQNWPDLFGAGFSGAKYTLARDGVLQSLN